MSTLLRDATVRTEPRPGPRTRTGAGAGATDAPGRAPHRLDALMIAVAVCVAVGAWIPFLAQPLSPDEAGFLHLAQHWHPGRSLYGDYWVDRPPLLIWLFDLAGHLGTQHHLADGLSDPGVKLLGAAATGTSVTLVGVLARLLVPTRRWPLAVVLAAAVGLVADPLLGMPGANGEVLALPFVLAGMVALVAAHRLPWGARAALLTLVAGAAAVAAASVKQNMVDVVVMAVVLLPSLRRTGARPLARLATFAAGGAATLAAVLLSAAARGTSVLGLWDAVVVFRLRASSVISSSASFATTDRAHALELSALVSGEVVLLAVAAIIAVGQRRRGSTRTARSTWSGRLVWAGLAVAVWEAFAVAAGGSYWSHYLTGLVPGTLLLLALALRTPSRLTGRVLTGVVLLVVLAGGVAWRVAATAGVPGVTDDGRVETFLRTHAVPGDGVVSAFGDPRLVAGSGLTSPYENLWSLPVRVRDAHLTGLTAVLTGPTAPRWVVVSGRGLGTWGVDATRAQRVFDRSYRHLVTYGVWEIFEHRDHLGGGTP
ncbi:hypothetical protein GCM10027596_31050 [Nocardioides korecus]